MELFERREPPTTGALLWEPSEKRVRRAEMTRYLSWLSRERGLHFDTYRDLQEWSTRDLAAFWGTMRDFFEVTSIDADIPVLASDTMPGAVWFPGATLNYAERALACQDDHPAVVATREDGRTERLSYRQLHDRVGAARAGLLKLGIRRGDRVAAVLPTGTEALVAMLATASLGAIWSSCSPDFGARAIADRFAQIEPRVLLAVDGYHYNGRGFDIRDRIRELQTLLPTVHTTVLLPYLDNDAHLDVTMPWSEFVLDGGELTFERVPFDHPLWILYSSGTTGVPKAIVHGHGGMLLEHLKAIRLHIDMQRDDRFFWFTTTGWMMWNLLAAGLLSQGTILLYDGSPGFPSTDALWALAEREQVTIFGAGAPFFQAGQQAGPRPRDTYDLHRIHTVASTGAPLSPEGFVWAGESIGDDVLVGSISGGTDVCTAFVGTCPLLPVRIGEIQARMLGCAVEAYDDAGQPLVGEPGELVITRPMPAMPLGLWGDEDGQRYGDAYFAHYPGIWRHGDLIQFEPDGGCIISGRSDATLNRGGVRMGTAEFYRVLDEHPSFTDSLVVDADEELLLFVVPATDLELDEAALKRLLRTSLTPRHVPDRIFSIAAVPRTATGKRLEVPIKRILAGARVEDVVDTGSLVDPSSLAPFVALARERTVGRTSERA